MQTLRNLSDTELIERFNNNDDNVFTVLFRRYQKDVYHVIHYYVNDYTVAEDLCQDAFVRIYTSLKNKRYKEQGNFLAWALRIARNLCMDYLRKEKQLSRYENCLHQHFRETPSAQSADSRLMTTQQEALVSKMISQLPDEQRKVVHYRYYEELSFREIAEKTNTNTNTSLGRMRYGLAHLRKQVSKMPACLW